VWGGIALNRAVGGVNPLAVEWFHRMSGGRGKVVWLPTFDADNQHKILKEPGEGLKVAANGKVFPETEEVLKIVARENLSLATGHVAPEESLAVIKRAKELGVKNILVTHGSPTSRDDARAGQAGGRNGSVHQAASSTRHSRTAVPLAVPAQLAPRLLADIARHQEVGAEHFIS
jgi:hypothetical protein